MLSANSTCSCRLMKLLLSFQIIIFLCFFLYATNGRQPRFSYSSEDTQLLENSTDQSTFLSSSEEYDNVQTTLSVSEDEMDSTEFNEQRTTTELQPSSTQPLCQASGLRKVIGSILFNLNYELNEWTLNSVAARNEHVQFGGTWRPRGCQSSSRLLVIIPYRDREKHLVVLLGHFHPLLREQSISYTIYVVEQSGNYTFNKGRLMNAAFKEATSLQQFDCVVFHDVDLIPEDNRIPYSCPDQPRHLSVAIDKFQYRLPYDGLIGGVLILRTEHFEKVNGYPTYFWGWGGEDDDMTNRLQLKNLNITRPAADIARYKMISHSKRAWNAESPKLLKQTKRRMSSDGLRSTGYYVVLSVKKMPLFTYMLIDVGTEGKAPKQPKISD